MTPASTSCASTLSVRSLSRPQIDIEELVIFASLLSALPQPHARTHTHTLSLFSLSLSHTSSILCALSLAMCVNVLRWTHRGCEVANETSASIPVDVCYFLISDAHKGRPIDKTFQCSNWASRPLSKGQQLYAALDALVLVQMFDTMRENLKRYAGIDVDHFVEDRVSASKL